MNLCVSKNDFGTTMTSAKPSDWQALTQLTQCRALVVERVRIEGSGIAIEGAFELPELARLPAEDQVFTDDVVRWTSVGVAGAGLASLVTGLVVLLGAPSSRAFDASLPPRFRVAAGPRSLSVSYDF